MGLPCMLSLRGRNSRPVCWSLSAVPLSPFIPLILSLWLCPPLRSCLSPKLLYVGDHMFADILRSKRTLGWRTCLIVPELEGEMNAHRENKELRYACNLFFNADAIDSHREKELGLACYTCLMLTRLNAHREINTLSYAEMYLGFLF